MLNKYILKIRKSWKRKNEFQRKKGFYIGFRNISEDRELSIREDCRNNPNIV